MEREETVKISVDLDQKWLDDYDTTVGQWIKQELEDEVRRTIKKMVKEEGLKREKEIRAAVQKALSGIKVAAS